MDGCVVIVGTSLRGSFALQFLALMKLGERISGTHCYQTFCEEIESGPRAQILGHLRCEREHVARNETVEQKNIIL
jgi:hypothetical protein